MSQRNVLLVITENSARTSLAEALAAQGYEVLTASSFHEGRRLLLERKPAVLVTALRLHEHNGIHLAVVSRLRSEHTKTIVLGYGDPVLEAEAGQAGAVYLTNPDHNDVLHAIDGVLHRRERRWPRTRANLMARAADQSVRLVDLSYGGVRIELPVDGVLPQGDEFPLIVGELNVLASRVWMKQQPERIWWGATIVGEESATAWREFVDHALDARNH